MYGNGQNSGGLHTGFVFKMPARLTLTNQGCHIFAKVASLP